MFCTNKKLFTDGGEGFIRETKAREDIEIVEVTIENRSELPDIILGKVRALGCNL